jgi:hypothetical protein
LKADSKKWAVCNNPLSLHAYPREYYPTGCIPQGELMSAVPFDYFFFDPDFSPGMPPLADIVEETGPISFITDNNKTLSLKSMTVLNHQAGMTDSPYITSVYISDDSSDTNFYFTFITAQKFSEYNKTDLYSILKTMDWR